LKNFLLFSARLIYNRQTAFKRKTSYNIASADFFASSFSPFFALFYTFFRSSLIINTIQCRFLSILLQNIQKNTRCRIFSASGGIFSIAEFIS
jgi:hypothetical protein